MQASTSAPNSTTTMDEEAPESGGSAKIGAISLTTASLFATFSYFFHIDYFPLFDLEAASSYLIAFIWVMVILMMVLGALLLMPYSIMAMALTSGATTKSEKKLTTYIIEWVGYGMVSMICLSAGVMLATWLNFNFEYGLAGGTALTLTLWGTRIYFLVNNQAKWYLCEHSYVRRQIESAS